MAIQNIPIKDLQVVALGANEKMLKAYNFSRYVDNGGKSVSVGSSNVTVTSERLIYTTQNSGGIARKEFPLKSIHSVSYSYVPFYPKSKAPAFWTFFIFALLAVGAFIFLPKMHLEKYILEYLKVDLTKYFKYIIWGVVGLFVLISFINFCLLFRSNKDTSNFAFEILMTNEKLSSISGGQFNRKISVGNKVIQTPGCEDKSYIRATKQCTDMVRELGGILIKVQNNETL